MSKEKLTVESTVNKIQLKVFVNTAELYSPHKQGEKELINLLKQIRDEMHNKATPFEDSSGYIYSKALFMSEVDDVFNKYLNEKGGK